LLLFSMHMYILCFTVAFPFLLDALLLQLLFIAHMWNFEFFFLLCCFLFFIFMHLKVTSSMKFFFSFCYWGKFSGKFVYTAIDTNHCHSIIHSCMLPYHMSIIEYRNWRKKKETFPNIMRVIYEILKGNKWNEKIQQASLG